MALSKALPAILSPEAAKDLKSLTLFDWLASLPAQDNRWQNYTKNEDLQPPIKPTRKILLEIYNHYEDLLQTLPASSHNHQDWPGGLKDHLAEMCRYAYIMYEADTALHGQPPYSWVSLVVAIVGHDAEKFVVYGPKDDPRCGPFHALAINAAGKEEKEKIKWHVISHWHNRFGLILTPDERNAIKYTHGEGADYRPDQRIMGPLAAAVGNADRHSARIRHLYGKGLG